MPNWVLQSNHSISPDGNAAIYSSPTEFGEIRGGIWFTSRIASGGAGLFTIKTNDTSSIELSWLSDSVALIQYPWEADLLRKEDSAFYFGRVVRFKYQELK